MGRWVVTRTAISDVLIFSCAYDWIQRSISYFLSTTVNTNPSLYLYISQFEDDFSALDGDIFQDQNFPTPSTTFFHLLMSITSDGKKI